MKNKFLHLIVTLLLCPQLVFGGFDSLDTGFLVETEFDDGNLSPEETESIASQSEVQVLSAPETELENAPISLSGQPVTGHHLKTAMENCEQNSLVPALKGAMPFPLESNCLNGRPRAAEYSFETEAFGNPIQYISSDSKACECMKGSGTGKIEEKSETKLDEDGLYLQNLLANTKAKQQRVQNFSEGIVVQSMLISGNKIASMRLMSMLANKQDSTITASVNKGKALFIRDAIKKLNSKTPEKVDRIKQIAEELFPPKGIEKMELPSAVPPEGSCITMQSYLSYEQAPKEPEFYADVAKMGGYSPKQWDLSKLKAEYDRAYIEAEQASTLNKLTAIKKLKSIKARINFLKKNPLVANFLSIRPEKINDGISSRRVRKFQEALFGLIKENLKPNTTVGSIAAFRTSLSRFFGNPAISMLVRTQLDEQIQDEYGKTEDLLSQKIPTTQPAIENRFGLISGGSVKGCSSAAESMDLEKCTKDFYGYCRLLAISEKGIKEKSFALNSPSENLEEQTQFDFNTNSEKNEGFKRVTDLLCHKKRVSKNDKNGRPIDFAGFKAEYCAVNGASAECQQASNEGLLQKFLTEYKFADDSLNNKATVQVGTVYSAIASVQPKVEFTKDDIIQVSSNVVAFSDLAKDGYSKNALFRNSNSKGEMIAPVDSMNKIDEKNASNSLPMNHAKGEEISPQQGILNPALAPLSPTAQLPYTNPAATHVDKALKEVEEERGELREKIAKTSEDISKAKKSEDRSEFDEMEKRLASLEKLLAKKDEEYKKLLDDQAKERDRAIQNATASSHKKATGGIADENSSGPASRSALGQYHSEEGASSTGGGRSIAGKIDGPASMMAPQSGSARAATGSGSGISGGAKTPGSSNMLNNALLEKYGIVVNGPTESGVLVAPEKDPKNLGLVSNAQEGKSVQVNVTSVQYEKFKINDLDSLQDIYEKKLKDISGNVLKISVVSNQKGSSPIEFYAIREGGKVVFQPVRTHELRDLRIMLKK